MKRKIPPVVLGISGLLFIAILFQACTKQKPHYTIDADMKAAFNYLPGTYWVYKDSVSGDLDSFYINGNSGLYNVSTYEASEDQIDIEIIEYNIQNNKTFRWDLGLAQNELLFKWTINPYRLVYYSINYPFKIGYTSYHKGIVTNIFSTLIMSNQNYTNVAEWQQASSIYHPIDNYDYDDWFYISSDAGIIKMRLNHPSDSINHIWELLRYSIVK